MKTGKTPYEIRLDLLELAFGILKGQKEAECAEEATSPDAKITKAPTTEEVLAEAEKLNSFVSQSNEGK
jgi:hypothetical protein